MLRSCLDPSALDTIGIHPPAAHDTGMSSPNILARAQTAPFVQQTHPAALVRSPTNYIHRDRHAVPPSILAQNRELLGITERPQAMACDEARHNFSQHLWSESPDRGHIENGQSTMAVVSPPPVIRRQTTFTKLGETARKSGRNVKRKLSRVISWKRRDSGNEDETTSPPSPPKVQKRRLRSGTSAAESRDTLLHDEQDPSRNAWEDAVAFGSYTLNAQHRPSHYEPLQLDLSKVRRISTHPGDWEVSPQTRLRLSVEYHSEHALSSPDCFPHENFMENSLLWAPAREKLEECVRKPWVVQHRFEKIQREIHR